jgi:quercetin dioxygenase-like cupin family protein
MGQIFRFADIPFHIPPVNAADLDLESRPGPDEAGRKFLARGEGGFYSQVVRIPPGFVGPVHAHDHAEIFLVLTGSCTFNDESLQAFDSTVVEANEPYAFTAGADGVQFLVVRQAPAKFVDAS